MKTNLTLLLILLISTLTFGQAKINKIISGPMIGQVSEDKTYVWILVQEKNKKEFKIVLRDLEGLHIEPVKTNKTCQTKGGFLGLFKKKYCSIVFEFDGLKKNNSYEAVGIINGEIRNDIKSGNFVLKEGIEDFSFLLGSCAQIGQLEKENIFSKMNKEDAQFMVWLGDNIYYDKGIENLSSKKANKEMFFQQVEHRKYSIARASFLKNRFHFGIWDDHDYGNNDSQSNFPHKQYSLQLMKSFYPRNYENEGTYSKSNFGDIEFFLTDNRWFKNDDTNTMLGLEQLNWLKTSLLNSKATFKFIVLGSSVIISETFSVDLPTIHSSGERDSLYNFIFENNIEGVIFLSGDRHYSYLGYRDNVDPECYPFYEFDSSPLTSGAHDSISISRDYPESIDYFHENSYGKITISGKKGNRNCLMEMKNRFGITINSVTINERKISCGSN